MAPSEKEKDFSEALKHAFYIHRDIVSDLRTQLDTIKGSNEKLKKELDSKTKEISKSCQSCAHLQEMNQTLQKHFQSRLKDKNILIKHLESRLKALGDAAEAGTSFSATLGQSEYPDTDAVDTLQAPESVENQGDKHEVRKSSTVPAAEARGVIHRPDADKQPATVTSKTNPEVDVDLTKEADYLEESSSENSTDKLNKPTGKLALSRQGKRHSRYQEHQSRKKQRLSESVPTEQAVLVLDTEAVTQVQDLARLRKSAVTIPETQDMEFDLKSDNDSDLEDISILNTSHTSSPPAVSEDSSHQQTVIDNVRLNNEQSVQETDSDTENTGRLTEEAAGTSLDDTIAPAAFLKQAKPNSLSKSLAKKKAEVTPTVSKSNFDGKRDGRPSVTPKISNLKTLETPDSVSPRIFDSVKVSKDKPADTPHRGSETHRKRSSLRSSQQSHVRVCDEEEDLFSGRETTDKSLKQSTITQAFQLGQDGEANKSQSQEEEDIAEAIHRSLQDFRNSHKSENLPETMKSSLKTRDKENSFEQHDGSRNVSVGNCDRSTKKFDKMSPMKRPERLNNDLKKLKERSPNILESLPQSTPSSRHMDSMNDASRDLFNKPSKVSEKTYNKRSDSVFAMPPQRSSKVFKDKSLLSKQDSSLSDTRRRSTSIDSSSSQVVQDQPVSSNNEERIAPHHLTPIARLPPPSLDSEPDFTLPSLQSVLGTKEFLNLRFRISTSDLEEDQSVAATQEEETDSEDDLENETIAPSPQHTMRASQLVKSLPSKSCKANNKSFQFNKTPKPLSSKVLKQSSVKCVDVKVLDQMEEPVTAVKGGHSNLDRGQQEYAHVAVVRKHSERAKLQGFSCKECEDYYKHSGLSEAELQVKMQACSRHRDKYAAPATPEHYWSIGFPDTAEDHARDAKESSMVIARPPRRRVKLAKKF